ncbi:MAG: hypothetical protein R3F49_22015 [Planctomycetota bacterium]
MTLKPQDLVVGLSLTLPRYMGAAWTYAQLADSLYLSDSEANAAARRAGEAGLLAGGDGRRTKPRPVPGALLEFIEHGVRYAFYAHPGERTRGTPTAHSASPLAAEFAVAREDFVVWPDASGSTRGAAVEPLYPTVPDAARASRELYELLALVDAVRIGRTRERARAIQELRRRVQLDDRR